MKYLPVAIVLLERTCVIIFVQTIEGTAPIICRVTWIKAFLVQILLLKVYVIFNKENTNSVPKQNQIHIEGEEDDVSVSNIQNN